MFLLCFQANQAENRKQTLMAERLVCILIEKRFPAKSTILLNIFSPKKAILLNSASKKLYTFSRSKMATTVIHLLKHFQYFTTQSSITENATEITTSNIQPINSTSQGFSNFSLFPVTLPFFCRIFSLLIDKKEKIFKKS